MRRATRVILEDSQGSLWEGGGLKGEGEGEEVR